MARVSREYCIELPPQAWSRAGLSGKRFFDKQKQEKLAFGLYLAQQHAPEDLLETPLEIDFIFFMPIPMGKKNKLTDKPHITKPDIDNLIKFMLDTATGVIFKDDKQVIKVSGVKQYDAHPRVTMTVVEIK